MKQLLFIFTLFIVVNGIQSCEKEDNKETIYVTGEIASFSQSMDISYVPIKIIGDLNFSKSINETGVIVYFKVTSNDITITNTDEIFLSIPYNSESINLMRTSGIILRYVPEHGTKFTVMLSSIKSDKYNFEFKDITGIITIR